MNTKRKADLQRRLSMASMPKPPAGLAERIKADIPDLLATTRERDRLSRSMFFNMRVAASIILLVGSAYLCLHLLSRASNERVAVATGAPRMAPVHIADNEARVPPQRALEAAPPPAPVQQPAVDHLNDSSTIDAPAAARPAPTADALSGSGAFDLREAARRPEPAPERITVTAEAPLIVPSPASAPPPPPPADFVAPLPAPVAPQVAEEKTAAARSAVVVGGVVGGVLNSITPSATAADINIPPRQDVFGISTDPNAFERVKEAIEHGERPHNVNVEALINYFAGAPRRTPREVSLDVEASPAPLSAGPRGFIIRTTIDTARTDVPSHVAAPLAITDARLDIELDSAAVLSHHRLGSDTNVDVETAEPTLLKNVSATALYAVELRSNLPWRQRVATVRLHYRSVATGREHTITRVVRASDFAHSWPEASTRHRLASLGAVWGETLKNATGANDVAKRAEELASQEPSDSKARELAMLASASSRLQSSAPTGSGR